MDNRKKYAKKYSKKSFPTQDERDDVKDSISTLKGELDAIEDQMEITSEDLFPPDNMLPGMDLQIEIFDYDEEIRRINEECVETLEAISNLYLEEKIQKNKNIGTIIKNDADALAVLNFSLSCSKRGLISLMKSIDLGINDPEMFLAVSSFQKEMRDSIKTLNDIKGKMKEFYKGLKEELSDINTGGDIIEETIKEEDELNLIDPKKLNKILEQYKNNPKLIE